MSHLPAHVQTLVNGSLTHQGQNHPKTLIFLAKKIREQSSKRSFSGGEVGTFAPRTRLGRSAGKAHGVSSPHGFAVAPQGRQTGAAARCRFFGTTEQAKGTASKAKEPIFSACWEPQNERVAREFLDLRPPPECLFEHMPCRRPGGPPGVSNVARRMKVIGKDAGEHDQRRRKDDDQPENDGGRHRLVDRFVYASAPSYLAARNTKTLCPPLCLSALFGLAAFLLSNGAPLLKGPSFRTSRAQASQGECPILSPGCSIIPTSSCQCGCRPGRRAPRARCCLRSGS